jgi:SSS family transporter
MWMEYIIIAAYLGLMIAIGIVFKKFNKNAGDYFRSNSQATWWMVGMSSFMTGISALTFTGNGGAAYEAGWSVLFIYAGNAAGVLFHFLFLAPWFRQLRATTFPQVVRERFGPVTQQIYAYVWSLLFLLTGAIWLLGLAIYGSSTFGLPMELLIPVLGLVVLFYSTTGGKWAVLAADFVQGLILVGMTMLITILCLAHMGGVDGFFEAIKNAGLNEQYSPVKPDGAFPANAYTWQWALAMFGTQIITMCSIQSGAKYFVVKDGREARRASMLTLILKIAGPALWFIPPITARILFNADVMESGMPKPAEAAYAVACAKFLPAGLVGMMAVAMFSATMSSMDAGLNGNAAMFVKDVVPGICRLLKRRPPNEVAQLWLGRLVTMVFGVLVILMALYMSRLKNGMGVFEIALQVSSMLVLPMTLPLILCLFIRKAPKWAAIFSGATTLIPSAIATFSSTPWSIQEKVFWVFATGGVAFLLTRLFWRTADEAYRRQVDAFFEKMHRPVDFAAEVGKPNDSSQMIIMGRFTCGVAVFTLLLLLIPNPVSGRLCIIALAAGLFLVGGLLLFAGRRKPQAEPKKPGE